MWNLMMSGVVDRIDGAVYYSQFIVILLMVQKSHSQPPGMYITLFTISPGERRISEPSTVFQVSLSSFNVDRWNLNSGQERADWLWSLYIEAMDFPRTYWVGKSYTPPQNKYGTWKWGPLGNSEIPIGSSIISRFHVEFWVCRSKYGIWSTLWKFMFLGEPHWSSG